MAPSNTPDPASAEGKPSGAPGQFRRDPVYERWRWQIFAITWLAYAGLNLTRKSFPVVKSQLGAGTAIGLTTAQMGWIDGSFLAAYAIGQFFAGSAADRLGVRKVALAGMVCSAAVGLAMGSASTAAGFAAWYLIQGFCQATGWAPLLKNMGEFFSRRERGTVMGLWCTNYAIGGMAASALAGVAGEAFGWRFAFFVPALGLLIVACLFFIFQRNRPEDVGLPAVELYHCEGAPAPREFSAPAKENRKQGNVIGEIVANPMILVLGMAYLFVKPARYLLLFWAPKYLSDRLGVGMAESGILSGVFEVSGPFAIVLAGWASDRFFGSRRVPLSIVSLALLAATFLMIDHLPHTRWALAGGLCVAGFLVYAPDMMIAGIAAVDFGTKEGAGRAAGFINGLGSLGAVAGGMLPGFALARWGWSGVFNVLAVLVLAAAILLAPKWNATPANQ